MSLITLSRLKQAITVSAANEVLAVNLINACSEFIENYTGREFGSTEHDEVVYREGGNVIQTNHFPVTDFKRVSVDPISGFQVRNTSASVKRATAAIKGTNLILKRLVAGVETSNSISLISATTLTVLKTHVEAVGNGWEAEIADYFEDFPSLDLVESGPNDAKDVWADLILFAEDFSDYQVFDYASGQLVLGTYSWEVFRLVYDAGYASIPNDIQQVCVELVSNLLRNKSINPALQTVSLGQASYTVNTALLTNAFNQLSLASQKTLSLYRNVNLV